LFEEVNLLFGLVLFLLFSGLQELLDIGSLDHEVYGVFTRAFELDGTWRLIAIKIGPLFSHLLVALEHRSIEFYKVFGDDRLVFSRVLWLRSR